MGMFEKFNLGRSKEEKTSNPPGLEEVDLLEGPDKPYDPESLGAGIPGHTRENTLGLLANIIDSESGSSLTELDQRELTGNENIQPDSEISALVLAYRKMTKARQFAELRKIRGMNVDAGSVNSNREGIPNTEKIIKNINEVELEQVISDLAHEEYNPEVHDEQYYIALFERAIVKAIKELARIASNPDLVSERDDTKELILYWTKCKEYFLEAKLNKKEGSSTKVDFEQEKNSSNIPEEPLVN